MDFWTKFLIVLFITYIITLNYLSSDNISAISHLASNYELIKVKKIFIIILNDHSNSQFFVRM